MYNHKSSVSTAGEHHPEVICELCMNYGTCLLFLHNKLRCIKWDKFIIMQLYGLGIGFLCLKLKYCQITPLVWVLEFSSKAPFVCRLQIFNSRRVLSLPYHVAFSMLWEFVSLWLQEKFSSPLHFSDSSLSCFFILHRPHWLGKYTHLTFDEFKNALWETLIMSLKYQQADINIWFLLPVLHFLKWYKQRHYEVATVFHTTNMVGMYNMGWWVWWCRLSIFRVTCK